MFVKIGNYPGWFGPYQLVDMIQKVVPLSEDQHDRLSEWFDKDTNWIGNLLKWIHKKNKRKVVIRIDKFDSWNADTTLALIILPILKQLKETKHGSPFVDDEDVPSLLRKDAAPPTENEWDTDDNFHLRWEYVLNEMIWAFEQIVDDNDEEQFYGKWIDSPDKNDILGGRFESVDRDGLKFHHERIRNGTRLFGKYYQGLWD